MSWFGKEHGPYQLSQNDFLDATLRETITSADVIFVNNFAFGTKLNQQLKEIFSDCKEGCRIVSSLNFSPLDFSITTRTLYVSRAASLCLGIWGLFFHSSALCVTPPILFCLPQLFSFIHSLIHSFVFLFVCLSSHPFVPPFLSFLCCVVGAGLILGRSSRWRKSRALVRACPGRLAHLIITSRL